MSLSTSPHLTVPPEAPSLGLMRQIGILPLAIGLLAAWTPDQVGASAYECHGPTGASVFTDDPTGFQDCHALTVERSQLPPADSAPAGGTSDSREAQPLGGLGLANESFPLEPSPDEPEPRPEQPASHDPEYSPAPRIVAPSGQTCARGMNRLNPFGGGPCASSGSPAPIPVPREDYFR